MRACSLARRTVAGKLWVCTAPGNEVADSLHIGWHQRTDGEQKLHRAHGGYRREVAQCVRGCVVEAEAHCGESTDVLRATSAVATAARPSPRPVSPSPSVVVAVTLTGAPSAADSAAVAGEHEILAGQSASVVSAAQHDAALNDFTDGTGTIKVTVSSPPTSGPHTGSSKAVEVIVSETHPTYLLRVIGIPNVALGPGERLDRVVVEGIP